MTLEPTGLPVIYLDPDLIHQPGGTLAGDGPIRLAGTRCVDCGRVDFPARAACSQCGGQVTEHALSTRATLGPRTAVLHAPPGALVEVPYHMGVAEFPEGIAVLGLLATDEELPRGTTLETIRIPVGNSWTYGFRAVADPPA